MYYFIREKYPFYFLADLVYSSQPEYRARKHTETSTCWEKQKVVRETVCRKTIVNCIYALAVKTVIMLLAKIAVNVIMLLATITINVIKFEQTLRVFKKQISEGETTASKIRWGGGVGLVWS